MEQPTEAQIKEFWEWCGFTLSKTKSPDPIYELLEPDGEQYNIWFAWKAGTSDRFDARAIRSLYPQIDLNNLFEYALPMLLFFKVKFDHIETSLDFYVTLTDFYLAQPCRIYKAQHQDPALSLFWAIWEVIITSKGE